MSEMLPVSKLYPILPKGLTGQPSSAYHVSGSGSSVAAMILQSSTVARANCCWESCASSIFLCTRKTLVAYQEAPPT